ncbi:MAG: tape measure protein, partial [Bacteroidales bacterium]|nr:tape measure protein [Bacteroidales bacterium]
MPNTYRIDIDASAINNAMNQVAKLDQHFDALIASVTALNSTVKTNFDAVAASTKEVASSTKSMLTEMEKGYKGLSEGIGKGYDKAMGKLISETDITVKHLVGQYDTMARNTAKAMGKQNSVVISMTQKMNKESVKNLKEMQNGFREEVGGIKAVFYELMREAKANTDGTVAAFKAMSTGVRDDLKSVNTALRSTIATVLSFKRSMRDNMGDAVKQLKSTTSSMSTEMAFLRGDIQKLSRQFDKSTKEMVKANQQMADEVTQALIRIKQEQQYLNKHSKQNITSLGDLWREFRRGVATVMAAYYAIRMISAAFRTFIDHTLLMEGVNKRFASMSGGLTEGVQVLGDLKKVAAGMGLEYKSLFEEYSKFYAATKNNPILAKESMAIFEGVTAAGAALGLTNEKMKLVTYALMQMASKGRVLSEEMTRQLGDNLPGALQIAARSLGLTTAEFVKMMQEGNILAEDFLPAFGREMKKQFGDVAVSNIHSTQGALNELNNALFELKEFLMTDMGGSAFFRSMISGFAGVVDSIKTAISYWAGTVGEGSAKWKPMQVATLPARLAEKTMPKFTLSDLKEINALKYKNPKDASLEEMLGQLPEQLRKRTEAAIDIAIDVWRSTDWAREFSMPEPQIKSEARNWSDFGMVFLNNAMRAETELGKMKKELLNVEKVLKDITKERDLFLGVAGTDSGAWTEWERSLFKEQGQSWKKYSLRKVFLQDRIKEEEMEDVYMGGNLLRRNGQLDLQKRMGKYGNFSAFLEDVGSTARAQTSRTFFPEGHTTVQQKNFKEEQAEYQELAKEYGQTAKFAKEAARFKEREYQLTEKRDALIKMKQDILQMEKGKLEKALKMVKGQGADLPEIISLRDYGIDEKSRDDAAKELDKKIQEFDKEIAKENAEFQLKLDKVRAGQLKKYAPVTGNWDPESAGFKAYFDKWVSYASEPEKQAEMEDMLSRISSLMKHSRTDLQKALDNRAEFQKKATELIKDGAFTEKELAAAFAALDVAVANEEALVQASEQERIDAASRAEYRKKKLYNLLRGYIGDMSEEDFIKKYSLLTPGQQKALEDAAKQVHGNVRRTMTQQEKLIQNKQALAQQQSVFEQSGITWSTTLFQEAMNRQSDQIEALRIQHDESLQKMIKMVDNWESRFIDAFMNVVKTGKFA